jgi:hypothetical protein
MKILPFSTLPLRTSLHVTGRRDAADRAKIEAAYSRFRPWSDLPPTAAATASITAHIHPYPGLGHQLAGWISGYLWAQDLGMNYGGGLITRDAHGLFDFRAHELPGHSKGVKTVRLTSVNDERDSRGLTVLQGQINRALDRAKGAPLHFRLALDQPRWDQTPAAEVVRGAVLGGARGRDLSDLEAERPGYVAIHVRRGDVSENAMGGATGHSRWTDETWYLNLLRQIRQNSTLGDLEVRVYALGRNEDFPMLRKEGVTLCLNGDRDSDFVELCGAKVLVAAPSSFSFTAALASRGVVIARAPWWHNIPDDGRWITADQDGIFSRNALDRAISCAR